MFKAIGNGPGIGLEERLLRARTYSSFHRTRPRVEGRDIAVAYGDSDVVPESKPFCQRFFKDLEKSRLTEVLTD